jgi:hypothetical protein
MKLRFLRRSRGAQPDAPNPADPNQGRVFHIAKAGLVTGWYLARRCEEECYRAERYRRPLALLLAEPEPNSEEDVVKTWIGEWLLVGLRMTDVPAYLGGARYAILLPETTRANAAKLAARLRTTVQQARTAVVTYPQDGQNFGELVSAAHRSLDPTTLTASERLAA